MGIAYLYGNGGGGSGGNLSVTAPEGVVVTVSKDDKTYSKFVGTDGLAKFTGLESGTWTVSITDETQTATTTVNIKIDHSTTIAFFGATITATFPTATSECRCYYKDDPGIEYYATEEELSAGKAVFTVSKSGTWVVACTDGIDSAQKEVSISSNGSSASASLTYHTYLYRSGDRCTSVTGGWMENCVTDSSAGAIAGRVTWGTNSVTLAAEEYQNGIGNAEIYTKNKINLSNYKTLTIKVSSATNRTDADLSDIGNHAYLEASRPSSSNRGYVRITKAGTFTIDTSNITGTNASCYVAFLSMANSMTITEVYLD